MSRAKRLWWCFGPSRRDRRSRFLLVTILRILLRFRKTLKSIHHTGTSTSRTMLHHSQTVMKMISEAPTRMSACSASSSDHSLVPRCGPPKKA